MEPKHILFIVNPVSGRMKSKAGLFEILDELYRDDAPEGTEKSGLGALPLAFGNLTPSTLGGDPVPERRVTVCPTMHRGHAAQLAASSLREGMDTVICCGGDGSLNETVSGLMTLPPERRPVLGYIPAGSTNDFAASLGLPGSLREAARVAVGDREMRLDVGRFTPVHTGDSALPGRHFTYIASFGLFTAVSYSTPQAYKNLLGHLAYLLEGVKDIANIQPYHASFAFEDGQRLEGDYVFGAVTNTLSAGGVFKLPEGSVSMSDGEFEVFLIHHPHSVAELNRIITALATADFWTCPLIEFHHATVVSVTTERPLRWSLDGEEAEAGTQVEIECLPGAIRFKAGDKK